MGFHVYEYNASVRCIKKIMSNCIQKKNIKSITIMLILLPVLIYANHMEIKSMYYLEDVFKRRNNSTMKIYLRDSLLIFVSQSAALSIIDYLFAQVYITSFKSSLADYIKMPFDDFRANTLGQLANKQYEKGEAAAKVVYIFWLHGIRNLFKIASVLYELRKKGSKHMVTGLAVGGLVHFAAFFMFSREHRRYQKRYLKAKINACSMVESESANFDTIKTSDLGATSAERVSGAVAARRERKVAFDTFRCKVRLAYKSFEIFCIVFFYSFYYRGMLAAADLAGMLKQITSLYESLRELLKNLGDTNTFFFTFYTLECAMEEPRECREQLEGFGEMRVTDLSFESVFSGVSMTVRRGEKVAVVGKNGSGKTMLLRALGGLSGYSGSICIDGKSLDTIDRGDLYRAVTVVSQSDSYTSGSIMKNLQYGNGLSREEVVEKCKEFGVDEVFRNLENGYDKCSSACGRELSGGQRQRVNFMRGVLRRTPVLIMDDCLSGVNTHSRVSLLSHLLSHGDRTLIMTTHNFDMLPKFDKILLLDGANSKFGSFSDLKEDIRKHIINSIRASC